MNLEEIEHIGFCLDTYNLITCVNCPMEKECLELRDQEQNKEVVHE